jgi:uncharacterized protein (TIRG00374 family)
VIRSLVLGLAVGALFLALALWGVPLDELGRAFAQMHSIYLLHLVAAFALQYALRAWRQLVLVRTQVPGTSYRTQLGILMIGFFCVNSFPARLGEAVRPYLWYEKEGVSLGAGFGLVFVERVLDVVALFLTVLGVLLWVHVPDRHIELLGRSVSLLELGRGAALTVLPPVLLALVGLAAFGPAALRLGERAVAAVEARVRARALQRFARFALGFAESFVEGVAALRSARRLALLGAQTAAIFASMGLTMVYLARAFGLESTIGFGAGMGVLAVTMLGIALPAPPGFAGVFEAAARGGLALFGVQGGELGARALAYALLFHWWQFLLMAAAAGFFLWRDQVGLGRLFRFARGPASGP